MSTGQKDIQIGESDFEAALSKVFPSVSKRDEMAYARLQTTLRKSRGQIDATSKEQKKEKAD